MRMDPAREGILGRARAALGRHVDSPVTTIPTSARVAARPVGEPREEMELLLREIVKLGGTTLSLRSNEELGAALEGLVRTQAIKKATVSCTPDLQPLGIVDKLQALGVETLSPNADKYALAGCDLGVTSVDAALPETGTLVLSSSPERPRMISLLPRVHVALVSPAALRSDLGPVLAENRERGYLLFLTGPSRTSDIELTVTIGVHGPKALYVWVVDLI